MNTRARITTIPALALAGITGRLMVASAATQATPETVEFDLLELSVDSEGVKGMPSTIIAGRYMVQISSSTPAIEDGIGVLFAILPDGVTPEQALEEVQTADPYPTWFYNTHFGGGVNLQYAGTENWGVVDLTPGNWIVTSLGADSLGIEFEVTGEFPTEVATPGATVSIELEEMSITITEGELLSGTTNIQVCNTGEQIHHLSFVKVPDDTTRESVQALWDSYMSGTPDADALSEEDTTEVAYFAEISPAVCEWGPLTLEPGTYVLSCFVGDPAMGGMPHAFMGMFDIVTIK